MFHNTLTRGAVSAALAVLALVGGASAAAAQPDPGGPAGPVVVAPTPPGPRTCGLRRVGAQLVRCDNLTGAGVRAPGHILELGAAADAACFYCSRSRSVLWP